MSCFLGFTHTVCNKNYHKLDMEMGDFKINDSYEIQREIYSKCRAFNKDVLEVFYKIPQDKLEKFLKTYRFAYGNEDARYLGEMYSVWKAKNVNPGDEILERIVTLLPRVLDFKTQCYLLKKLHEKFRKKDQYELKVNSNSLIEEVTPLIEQIVNKAYTVELPHSVEERLKWLSFDDLQIAKTILSEVQAQEGMIIAELFSNELETINRLLDSIPNTKSVIIHTIELPYGSIKLNIERSVKMDEKDDKIMPKPQSLFRPTPEDVLNNALENLDQKEAKEINKQAAQEFLKLAVSSKEKSQKVDNAKQDIGNLIDNATKLDRLNTKEYTIQGTYEGASGSTSIYVKGGSDTPNLDNKQQIKDDSRQHLRVSNNQQPTMMIVIFIVFGSLFLWLYFNK